MCNEYLNSLSPRLSPPSSPLLLSALGHDPLVSTDDCDCIAVRRCSSGAPSTDTLAGAVVVQVPLVEASSGVGAGKSSSGSPETPATTPLSF